MSATKFDSCAHLDPITKNDEVHKRRITDINCSKNSSNSLGEMITSFKGENKNSKKKLKYLKISLRN